jgi:hypothetical protein
VSGPFANSGEGMHELTPASASPTVIIERNEDGTVIEATISMLSKVELWIDLAGNLLQCPMTNTRVLLRSSEAERYERMLRIDMLRGGMIPVTDCPFTQKYEDVIGAMNGGRPVKLSKGADQPNCNGKKLPPGTDRFSMPTLDFHGCEHMEALIKARRAVSAAKVAEAARLSPTLMAQAEAIGRGIGQTMAGQPARRPPRSEPDAPLSAPPPAEKG